MPQYSRAHAHEEDEGVKLGAVRKESVEPGSSCTPGATVRRFDLVALRVDITLNRYLDHDPEGRMYALADDVARIRAEEERNARARRAGSEPAVSLGLQGDAIQPLTIRVNQGECLRVALRNDLATEPASFHLHGSRLVVTGTGRPAVAATPEAMARPAETVAYEWMVPVSEPEGTHYFHSHGNDRLQTSHGLFGAVIVEPAGSRHVDPLSGAELRSGWAAVIDPQDGPAFREFAFHYHEIGNESYQLLARDGQFVPQVDPLTDAYRPGARALNYRSEPFLNRLEMQRSLTGRFDESLAYSSYAFGDPATPIARAYLGDPAKQRIVHGGSEVFHVHHVHGGSVRWPRQPGAEPYRSAGLEKHPPLRPSASERTDSQSIGPSETFDVESECPSGGCQASAGDFLVHCHVAHHYFAGMWGIARVYNTLQDGSAATDALPPLLELPDRAGRIGPAVTSDGIAPSEIEIQLPPQGLPKGYDASVLDWRFEGGLYLNEPEDGRSWPGHVPSSPGGRQPLLFDPLTRRLAYPFLRPHLGKRPPFAPGHGPSPFLDPARDPPAPGASGPASTCPLGTRLRTFVIHAITTAIPLNEREGLVDPLGQIYVLKSEEDAVRAEKARRVPLALRANAAEDCVDVVFKSELEDTPENGGFSKADIHIHFVQFDIQGSDGVVTGFNYEQSVRPFRLAGEALIARAQEGTKVVRVGSTERFSPGALVGVGMDEDATFEVRRIASVAGDIVSLEPPLEHSHEAGELVSAEFVRYRWYPDVQVGTVYFHDHVNAIDSWRHGLFGALVVEPPGSTYHDPKTGATLASGPVADIYTADPVSVDVTGSFRELVVFIQDDNAITHVGRSSGSSINLRVEPLDTRSRGDPETPILEAIAGDPVVLRTLVAGTNEVHTLHVDGHWFRVEPWSRTSAPVSTVQVGISERYDLVIPAAGGPERRPGDYVYENGRSVKRREGSWGLLRVLSPGGALLPLPGREPPAPPSDVCPEGAPTRRFAVTATVAPLAMLSGAEGRVFTTGDGEGPLVLHANSGDCIVVSLANQTPDPVAFHPSLLARGKIAPVAPGSTAASVFYAHPETGEAVAFVRDSANEPVTGPLGLYGAIVIGPPGTVYREPSSRREVSSGWTVIAEPPGGRAFVDATLLLHDEDASIGTHRMPYTTRVDGTVGVNYSAAPLQGRRVPGGDPAFPKAASTPLIESEEGQPVRLHVVAPWSEQPQVFAVEGHEWPTEVGLTGTPLVSAVHVGGREAHTLQFVAGAPGDYLYGDHREPYREAGMWGYMRVRQRPLSATGSVWWLLWSLGFLVASAVAVGLLGILSRRRPPSATR